MNIKKTLWLFIAYCLLQSTSSRRKNKCEGQYRCSRSTNRGEKCKCLEKTRLCNGPEDCPNGDDEAGCPIKIDGLWADWAGWSECSRSCGSGFMVRFRTCTNPTPSDGGVMCVGVPAEAEECMLKACPVDGVWAAWVDWSTCAGSCGSGIQIRHRECTNPSPSGDGAGCTGSHAEATPCQLINACPVDGMWGEWSITTDCSVTCGGGTRTRTRTCNCPLKSGGGNDCVGEPNDTESCGTQNCPPVDGMWGEWSITTDCSVTCGVGIRERTRTCSCPLKSGGGNDCVGEPNDTESCTKTACPSVCGALPTIYDGLTTDPADISQVQVGDVVNIYCGPGGPMNPLVCKADGEWDDEGGC